jgi:hypothetical protein
MVQINVVARIADDKNAFIDMVVLAMRLKQQDFEDFRILFIGDILNTAIYQNIVRLATLLDVSDKIDFTKRSIRFADMDEITSKGYFLNYTIGSFMGYSGVESVRNGFKTIFYNASPTLEKEKYEFINFCADLSEVATLIKFIGKNPAAADSQILDAGKRLKDKYDLNPQNREFLLSVMLPKTV